MFSCSVLSRLNLSSNALSSVIASEGFCRPLTGLHLFHSWIFSVVCFRSDLSSSAIRECRLETYWVLHYTKIFNRAYLGLNSDVFSVQDIHECRPFTLNVFSIYPGDWKRISLHSKKFLTSYKTLDLKIQLCENFYMFNLFLTNFYLVLQLLNARNQLNCFTSVPWINCLRF